MRGFIFVDLISRTGYQRIFREDLIFAKFAKMAKICPVNNFFSLRKVKYAFYGMSLLNGALASLCDLRAWYTHVLGVFAWFACLTYFACSRTL